MLNKFIITILFVFFVNGLCAQNSYTKDEIDMKLELQQERVNSKLDAIERENNSIDSKITAQDKQIGHQDKQIENLKFIFGMLLSVIAIAVGLGAFFVDKRNKERFLDLEEELKAAKEDALQELKRIKDIANLEVRLAKAELNQIQSEAKKIQQKEEINESKAQT